MAIKMKVNRPINIMGKDYNPGTFDVDETIKKEWIVQMFLKTGAVELIGITEKQKKFNIKVDADAAPDAEKNEDADNVGSKKKLKKKD